MHNTVFSQSFEEGQLDYRRLKLRRHRNVRETQSPLQKLRRPNVFSRDGGAFGRSHRVGGKFLIKSGFSDKSKYFLQDFLNANISITCLLGWAATWVSGFVNCLGSREAAEQLWNPQKTFYKTSYPSNGPF